MQESGTRYMCLVNLPPLVLGNYCSYLRIVRFEATALYSVFKRVIYLVYICTFYADVLQLGPFQY